MFCLERKNGAVVFTIVCDLSCRMYRSDMSKTSLQPFITLAL